MEKLKKKSILNEKLHQFSDSFGNLLVDLFHYIALFAIGGAIVWSAAVAFIGMSSKGHASIEDILLLFIYLELGAMVGIYFKTNHMPVRPRGKARHRGSGGLTDHSAIPSPNCPSYLAPLYAR